MAHLVFWSAYFFIGMVYLVSLAFGMVCLLHSWMMCIGHFHHCVYILSINFAQITVSVTKNAGLKKYTTASSGSSDKYELWMHNTQKCRYYNNTHKCRYYNNTHGGRWCGELCHHEPSARDRSGHLPIISQYHHSIRHSSWSSLLRSSSSWFLLV